MDDLAHLKPPVALAAILDGTTALAFPMPSEPRTGAMLRMLAATKPGGRLLELGTGTGLSAAWLLDGMDRHARLITVDIDPGSQAVARGILGGDPRLEIVTEDAAVFLRRQAVASFDLIFADAMPGKYELLDEALALLRPGGDLRGRRHDAAGQLARGSCAEGSAAGRRFGRAPGLTDRRAGLEQWPGCGCTLD